LKINPFATKVATESNDPPFLKFSKVLESLEKAKLKSYDKAYNC